MLGGDSRAAVTDGYQRIPRRKGKICHLARALSFATI